MRNAVRLACGLVLGGWLVAAPAPAHAQRTDGCPIAAADYGKELQRTFTDSKGRRAQVFFKLPPNHNPAVATGILMYFHGNDADPTDSYEAPLYEIQDRADAHGFVAAGLKSIGTYADPDGIVRREWLDKDDRLLSELLLSDFGGCFKLDRARVYLEGASAGTCFLAAALSNWLWRDFQGGVIGLCGCWGRGFYDHPMNIPTLRNRWKVMVETTLGDFVYEHGLMGHDIYKYNFGLDVRADVSRPGPHCEDTRPNVAAALNWMTGRSSYTDPDANQPHWQMMDSGLNALMHVAYDAKGGRFVFAVQRADPSPAVADSIEQVRKEMFVDNYQGWLDWRDAMYPEYVAPPVLIRTTTNYGATFTQVARRERMGADDLWDVTVAPDGAILVVAGLGLKKVNESTKTIDAFAFPNMLIYGLDNDASGNVFAHGAVIKLQRSRDSGATWTELTVPVRNQPYQWVVNTTGGVLTVLGSDNRVYFSSNGGDSFGSAALPTGTMVDFASHGQAFYAVMSDNTLRVSQNSGTSWQTATVPGGVARAVEVLPNGDAVIAAAAAQHDTGLSYRSKDKGVTWARERGAHENALMEIAGGSGDQLMMVTTRGSFRHSTGALLDIGTPLPPLGSGTGGSMGAGGSTGAGGNTGAGGTTGAGGGAATGTGGSTVTGTGGAGTGTAGTTGVTPGGGSGGCGCALLASEREPVGWPAAAFLALALGMAGCRRRRPRANRTRPTR